jgi:hypothetical protein
MPHAAELIMSAGFVLVEEDAETFLRHPGGGSELGEGGRRLLFTLTR